MNGKIINCTSCLKLDLEIGQLDLRSQSTSRGVGQMELIIAEAYHKGRIAGTNHYFLLRRDSSLPLPSRPYSAAFHTVSDGWNRGFINGFEQGKRCDFGTRTAESELR
jgi:hypothetical protein